jgi:hypothetical protein
MTSTSERIAMTQSTTLSQRVNEPSSVNGDAPVKPEKDSAQLKKDMEKATAGDDAKLRDAERKAADDVNTVRPDHAQNDAGQ